MSNKIKFAIVGYGHIGKRHAEIVYDNPECDLVSVVDIDNNVKDEALKKYDADFFTSINELINSDIDYDVASICTPNGLHAEHSISFLNASKHVICEKPMATNVVDCEQMIAAAEENGKELFIVKQNRFNPPIVALKNVLEENKLGRLVNVQLNCFWNRNPDYYKNSTWKGKRDLDGGTLFTQFSHFVDLLLWLVGDIKNLKAYAHNFLHHDTIEFEDTGVVIVEFKNGAIGTINYTTNSYLKNMEGSITLFGEKGTVKVGGQYLNVMEYQEIDNYKITGIEESRPANNYGHYQGSMSNHDKVYENVLEVLHGNAEIATKGSEGLRTIKVIEEIYAQIYDLSHYV